MQLKGILSIPNDPKKILLIQLGDIGDVVLSFPVVRALREQFPDASLVAVAREKAKEWIANCPWASTCFQ